ncbi:gliding motility-associated-like protein [Algoriphagus boseongensis]|uniref:Gliding motility-associated-like protein n=1 Tax=Algoriphagus boseongensis TaxID=1442587 RepID=A0A4R6T7S7_9BACT|nr:gliding motility-associated C-terminal domain-containing protein [Algoriphagus boseongensis]TDQ16988.1 gliding motility-associated-like protein [Algoriphagus boseongensis]
MNRILFTYIRLGLVLLAMVVCPSISYSQYAFNIPSRETSRVIEYNSIWVEVSGKLALCSHSEKGNINLTVGGGKAPYTFKWNTLETSQNRTNLNAGTYTVWITDSEGKVHEQKIVIQPPFPLILNPVVKKDATCGSGADGYAKISVKIGRNDYEPNSPDYQVTWSNGLKNVWEADNLEPGVYTVTVADKYNCDTSVSFEIKSASEGIQVSKTIENISCSSDSNGKISLNVTGGQPPYTYKWNTGATTKDLSNLSAGTYQVQIQDSKGCSFQSAYTISASSTITLSETILQPSCQGNSNGEIKVNVSGGKAPYTYLWNTGETTASAKNLGSGTFSVKITDASGCQVEKQFSLTNESNLQIEILDNRPVSCSGNADGGISLGVKGAKGKIKVSWTDSPSDQLQRKDLKAGVYTVLVSDESGCSVSKTIEVVETQSLTARIESALDVDCAEGTVEGVAWVSIQGGKEPYQITWSTGSENSREISFNKSGTLKVTVKDALGCVTETETKVDFPNTNTQGSRLDFQYRKLSISSEPEVQVKEEIVFESEIAPEFIAWEWNFGDGQKSSDKDPIHIFEKPGTYEVSLTGFDMLGCSSIEKNTINVLAPTEMLVIPNAFSPNGDGLNDTFIPKLRGISSFTLEVFNTWGEKLFTTTSLESKGWDGTYKGQLSLPGNYLYKISFITPDGISQTKTGGITLIR